MLQSFSHVGLAVSDLDRSRRFYCDVLAFVQLYALDFDNDEVAVTMEQPGRFRSAMLLRDDVRLELLQWVDVPTTGGGGRKAMTELGFTHLCFRVERLEDMYDAVRAAGGQVHEHTVTELGVDGEGAPTRLVYATDPDGTRIELMENVPDLSGFTAADIATLQTLHTEA